MTAAGFTAGRFVVANDFEVHDRETFFDESGARIGSTANRIALIEYPYGDDAGKAANAHLFAAGPEMYAACKAALAAESSDPVDDSEYGRSSWALADRKYAALELIRAALSKAEGGGK